MVRARARAHWLFALLCCAGAGCQALDDDESHECTLQERYQASFTMRSGGGCIPEAQTLPVKAAETLETFIDKKVETVASHDGCQVALLVTTRERFSGVLMSQLSGNVVPQDDGELRGLLTFTTFDPQGAITCQATVDATLTPLFTSG